MLHAAAGNGGFLFGADESGGCSAGERANTDAHHN